MHISGPEHVIGMRADPGKGTRAKGDDGGIGGLKVCQFTGGFYFHKYCIFSLLVFAS